MNTAIGFVNGSLSVLTTIISPVIFLASWLMTPDWTSGDLFGMRPVLHNLWVLIANVTYFIYAVLLIFIALATIFNSDKYGYKQLLPKLALGILLVPLTWWFIQFIISLSTIVTASVINIPMETVIAYMSQENKKDSWLDSKTIQKKYQYYSDPGQKTAEAWQYKNSCPGGQDCLSVKDIIEK